ncbi:hypothetical protein TNCV_3296151 [Trichonephila clavipes]|uniref:Uncharacterized protein n=1 Tax=Trichonephila clavipes TaxID=2585209 RepID=A0A8X6SZ34_TRICX|nr:hypothetical protein TNCV_3296151 [Trichonephila clavipes]
MIKITASGDVWMMPKSVVSVIAIVGFNPCHTPQYRIKEALDVSLSSATSHHDISKLESDHRDVAGRSCIQHNAIPFHCRYPPFIVLLVVQIPVVSPIKGKRSTGCLSDFLLCCKWYKRTPNDAWQTESVVIWFVMRLHDPSLPCTQSTSHHGQWCNEVGAISPVGPSFPSASSEDRSASQLLGVSSNASTDFSKGTLLNSRGGSITRPSSFCTGKPTKACTQPSDLLAPYSPGPNNGSLWFFSNASGTKNSSKHLDPSHHIAILSLKQFSHRPPRYQYPQSDKSRQLLHKGTLSCLL